MAHFRRVFLVLMATFSTAFIAGCVANPINNKVMSTVDSAKIDFKYIKTDIDRSRGKNSRNETLVLSVFMDMQSNKIIFDGENINSAGVGWANSYELYQELECDEYSYSYLCVPSIKFVLPVSKFHSKVTWTHGLLHYINLGLQHITELEHYGPVFVINASHINDDKLIYTYYLTLGKGLVGFLKRDSNTLWVLSKDNEFGIGALSLGEAIKANSLTTSDIENYSIIKMVK